VTGPAASPRVVLGLAATPGIATTIAESLARDLRTELGASYPEAGWDVCAVAVAGLTGPVGLTEVLDVARAKLLEHGCDLLVLLTDLPLKDGRRPVLSHASPVQGVAVVSLPALGAMQLRSKARRAVLTTVEALLGARAADAVTGERRRGVGRRVRQLGSDVESSHVGVAFVARVVTGNLHLLTGMVRANRPWRLALRLQRALTGALAAVAFALVTSDIWRLADQLGAGRLALTGVASIATICITLVVGADLWERSGDPSVRQQVTLFNLATVATLVVGVSALASALFVLTAVASLLVVPDGLLGGALGHSVALSDRAELAWLVSALGVLGGALGAGLESDDAVREAAYANRHRRRPDTAHTAQADET
jgi:hypothetical protein